MKIASISTQIRMPLCDIYKVVPIALRSKSNEN
jgi:hypothetical protein